MVWVFIEVAVLIFGIYCLSTRSVRTLPRIRR